MLDVTMSLSSGRTHHNNGYFGRYDNGNYLAKVSVLDGVQDLAGDFDDGFDEECDEEFSDYDDLSPGSSGGTMPRPGDDRGEAVCDMTRQLLNFTEMVNADIQKYFGRKNDPDSCDIYENKWVTTKSGRELYYADLLRLAQGEGDECARENAASPEQKPREKRVEIHHGGKSDKQIGLGPLNELFEYGLKQFISDKKRDKKSSKKLKRLKTDLLKYEGIVPMQKRKLPQSFWKEPGRNPCSKTVNNNNTTFHQNSVITASKTPDFSDLLQSWGDDGVDFTEPINKAHQVATIVRT